MEREVVVSSEVGLNSVGYLKPSIFLRSLITGT